MTKGISKTPASEVKGDWVEKKQVVVRSSKGTSYQQ